MSLIHWYHLTEDLMDKITGEKLTGSFTSGAGKLGTSLETTSAHGSNFVMKDSWNPITSSVSMACWVKFDYTKIKEFFETVTSQYDRPTGNIVGNHYYAGLGLIWLGDSLTNFTQMQVFAHIRGIDANTGTKPVTIEDGHWTHIAFTADYNSKELKFYLNGQYVSSTSYVNLTDMGSAIDRKLTINYNAVYGGNGPGLSIPMSLNDIRVYNHALSEAEIYDLSKGMLIHYNFSHYHSINTCNWRDMSTMLSSGHGERRKYENGVLVLTAVNGWRAFMWDIGEDNVGKPLTYSFEYKIDNNIEGNSVWLQNADKVYYTPSVKNLNINQTEWKKETYITESAQRYIGINLRQRDKEGEETTLYLKNVKIALNNFDDIYSEYNEESRIIDESGYGHHGIVYNGLPSSDTARGNRSCYTPRIIPSTSYANLSPETASYIETEAFKDLFTPDSFTVSLWWKPLDWGAGTGPFGLVRHTGDYLQSTLTAYDNSMKVNFVGDAKVACPFIGCTLGQWNHYAITYKPGEVCYYVNGIKTTQEVDASLVLDPWRVIHLGAERAGGVLRDGDIYWGDFRYYTTCLSEYDISRLFVAKGYITNRNNLESWEFVEDKEKVECLNSAVFEAKEFSEDLYPGYDILEYIESTGQQYIDTEYITTSNDYGYELDMVWTGTVVGNFESFMGYIADNDVPRAAIHKYSSTFMFGADDTVNASSYVPQSGERLIIKGRFKSGAQKLYKNGEVIATSYKTFDHSQNLKSTYIFARNGGNRLNHAKMRLYEAKIYEGDQEVRRYIPARNRSDNTLGVYEVYLGKFYANKGSGTFVSGDTLTGERVSFYKGGACSANEIIEI